jgi:hypothetical protein
MVVNLFNSNILINGPLLTFYHVDMIHSTVLYKSAAALGESGFNPGVGLMSEALISETGSLLSESADFPVSTNRWRPYRSQTAGECPKLPTLQPGQLWYVELPSTELAFSPLEYQALTTANVVIYDRPLATTVARLMPIGGYAEPATPRGDASDGFDRCIRFARDGWSVVRLIHPSRWRGDIVQLAERLLRVTAPAALSASVFANTGSGYEHIEAELDQLGGTVDAWRFSRSPTLTIVFGAIDTGSAPRFSVASANGLAG